MPKDGILLDSILQRFMPGCSILSDGIILIAIQQTICL